MQLQLFAVGVNLSWGGIQYFYIIFRKVFIYFSENIFFLLYIYHSKKPLPPEDASRMCCKKAARITFIKDKTNSQKQKKQPFRVAII